VACLTPPPPRRLNHLRVDEGCTLRTNSRLLSGARMERHSTLLEHTLIVSGGSSSPQLMHRGRALCCLPATGVPTMNPLAMHGKLVSVTLGR
jgi:hypothetical protein